MADEIDELEDKRVSVEDPHDEITTFANEVIERTVGVLHDLTAAHAELEVVVLIVRPQPSEPGRTQQGMATTISEPAELAHVLARALQAAVDPEIIAAVEEQIRRADADAARVIVKGDAEAS